MRRVRTEGVSEGIGTAAGRRVAEIGDEGAGSSRSLAVPQRLGS
jgi:hypothetical protein